MPSPSIIREPERAAQTSNYTKLLKGFYTTGLLSWEWTASQHQQLGSSEERLKSLVKLDMRRSRESLETLLSCQMEDLCDCGGERVQVHV